MKYKRFCLKLSRHSTASFSKHSAIRALGGYTLYMVTLINTYTSYKGNAASYNMSLLTMVFSAASTSILSGLPFIF